jgi:hypothetical protein
VYIYVSGFATTSFGSARRSVLWIKPGPENFTLALNRSAIVGDNTAVGTITMLEARDHDVSFAVSDDSSLVLTPKAVTISAGSISKNFLIAVSGITSTVNTTIYARRGKLSRSHALRLSPLVPTAISFSPSQVTGGQTTTATVFINGVAGAGGRTVSLFDDSAYSDLPRSVIVPAGATSIAFQITTRAVFSPKTVTVTARVSAGEKIGTLRITP